MLFHIVRKELLDQLRSLRFAIACIVCLAVFMCSSLMLTRDYRAALSTYNMNSVLHRNDVLLLVIYNVLFFMLAYLFFLRYDVT